MFLDKENLGRKLMSNEAHKAQELVFYGNKLITDYEQFIDFI